jgi:integrase
MESRKMGKNPKVRIGLRELAAQPSGPFVLWDSGDGSVKGFCARRQFSDVITYSVIYRTKEGQQRWYKLGHHGVWTPSQAREKARQIRFAADNGKDPALERHELRSGATVAELCDEYVADMESHKLNGKATSTKKSDRSRVEKHIKPQLGKLRVAATTQLQIENFMNGCSPGSAKRLMQLLGAIFSFGIKKGLLKDNPCKGIVKPADVRKTRRLSVPEYTQLGTALNGSATVPHDIFLFLAVSGWRSSEARLLKHSEIDLERHTATLGDTKTGVSVRPLSSAAIEIINRQPPTNGEYVFALQGRPFSNIHPHWHKLEMPKDVTQHTLRHSFASLAADLGLADSTIAGLIGHKQQSITSGYLHLDKTLVTASNTVAAETLKLMRC